MEEQILINLQKKKTTINKIIKKKRMQKESLMETLGIKAIDYAKDIIQTSTKHEPAFVKHVMKALELDDEINQLINAWSKIDEEIEDYIDGVDGNNEKQILENRFLFNMKWVEISREMNYNERHIRRIYREIFKK